MTSTVEHTFVINLRNIPAKHLQISNGQVFVGTDSPLTAQQIVQEHNLQHQLQYEGKSYDISLSMEDGSIEVRIHDLRPQVSNQQLALRLREYGQIQSIRQETWKDFFPGVPNGIRIVRMKLIKPIPSYITVESSMTLVTYKGQTATCKHCNRNVHYTQKCSECAKSLQEQNSAQTRLLSDLFKTGPTTSTDLENTKQTMRPPTARQLSISSTEMDDEFPPLLVPDGKIQPAGNEMEITGVCSPDFDGTSEDPNIAPNLHTKRPASPMNIEQKHNEKRITRSQEQRGPPRSREASRTKPNTK
ncbi:uncharacterized protein LOC129742594 [Uranotaenia lowii]|uniref:uncharacterized protein LOC129742594 n=1 Tax=Uranotaenia lowii TaxID=190385 RepID=UPI00247AF7AE|nr:uncharacterized protein LOC129742594 [Uranotaenia lowii]